MKLPSDVQSVLDRGGVLHGTAPWVGKPDDDAMDSYHRSLSYEEKYARRDENREFWLKRWRECLTAGWEWDNQCLILEDESGNTVGCYPIPKWALGEL